MSEWGREREVEKKERETEIERQRLKETEAKAKVVHRTHAGQDTRKTHLENLSGKWIWETGLAPALAASPSPAFFAAAPSTKHHSEAAPRPRFLEGPCQQSRKEQVPKVNTCDGELSSRLGKGGGGAKVSGWGQGSNGRTPPTSHAVWQIAHQEQPDR